MISTQLRSPYSNFQRIPTSGVAHQILQTEILAENLVTKPWPRGFDPRSVSIPPYRVSHWLRDAEQVNLGGKDLQVIHTPGEPPTTFASSIGLTDCYSAGDILLHGPVWTHLDGGSLEALIMSYRKLMKYSVQLDHLMPSHNEPRLEKNLLPETLEGAENVLSGQAESQEVIDPWNRRLKQYSFGRFEILTPL